MIEHAKTHPILSRANCEPPFDCVLGRGAMQGMLGKSRLSLVLDTQDLLATLMLAKDSSYGSYFDHSKPDIPGYEEMRAYFDLSRKFARLHQLVWSPKAGTSESLKDALADIANNAMLALTALEIQDNASR